MVGDDDANAQPPGWDYGDMTGVALDDVTVRDMEWFAAHPLAPERYRPAFPVEVDLGYLDCPDADHYRVRVAPVGRARESFTKSFLHREHDGGRWRVAALGHALYPAGALDAWRSA